MSADGGALILAAGRSKRFGSDKRVHPINGTPMVLATAQRYHEVFSQMVIVLRELDISTASLLADYPTIHAADAAKGMGHSLAAGMKSVVELNWAFVFVGLADMPFVASSTLALLKQTMARTDATIVQPVYDGRPGHPVGFATRVYTDLLRLVGDQGARTIIAAKSAERLLVPVEDQGVIADVDRL